MQHPSTSSNRHSRQLPFGPKTLVLGATALIAYGLTRRSKAGTALAAAGGLLAYRAAQAPSTKADTRAVFLVNASPEQAYELWRNFAGLPRFMVHLKSVREFDGNRSEWVALGPGQREVRWTAEITEETANKRIVWRSLPNSDVHTSGSVNFRPDPQGRGTFVSVNMQYGIPGGRLEWSRYALRQESGVRGARGPSPFQATARNRRSTHNAWPDTRPTRYSRPYRASSLPRKN